MAKYSDIKGFTVQTVSTDPAASAAASGSWASGGDMNTTHAYAGAAGTQTAGLVFAGVTPAQTANTESYDGSSWTEVNNMNSAAGYIESAGVTYTAALAIGGHRPSNPTAFTEQWDGTNWTEVADLNTARSFGGSSGSATSALIYGGLDPSYPPQNAKTESWNGSSWTEVNDLNTNREVNAGLGVNNSNALSIAGSGTQPPSPTAVESWDGTSWTEVSEINTGRNAGSGFGAYDDGIFCGGGPGGLANTEAWNGSSWTEVADLANARNALKSGYGCPSGVGIAFGGTSPPSSTYRAFTEEWTTSFTPTTLKKVTEGQLYFNSTANAFKETVFDVPGATWASGGDLNTARTRFGGAGQAPQSAALVFGAGSSPYGQTEEYNGSAWSEQNDLNTGRYISPGGAGTQTAALTAGGYNPATSPNVSALSESYNGTSWTEGNDLNEGRFDCVTFGSSTSAILVGGGEAPGGPGTVTSVEIYDGTSWTETTDIPTATQEMAGWGTQTSGAIVGGSVDSDPTMKNTTVEWDGTSWSSGGNYSRNNKYFQAFGANVSAGLAAGGENPGESPARLSIAAIYNGTSWSEVAELSSARYGTAGGGTTLSGLISGGETAPTTVASTEEWTVNLSNKTITAS